MIRLIAYLLIAALSIAPADALILSPRTVNALLTENSFITSGPWGIFLGPFNKGIYTSPTYSQSATYPIDTGLWPNSIAVQWTWPTNSAVVNATITNGSPNFTINSTVSGSFIVGMSIPTSLTGVPSGTRLGPLQSGSTYTMVNSSGTPVNATQGNTGNVALAVCPGVCGFYQQASYGNYFSTVPQTPITPRQINAITTLTCQHSLTFSGALDGYDSITDWFITAAANDNTPLFEVEVFHHTPAYSVSYVTTSLQLGTLTMGGVNWTVAVDPFAGHGPDFLLMPSNQADFAAGSVDMKAVMNFLVALGPQSGTFNSKPYSFQVLGTNYYNGHAIGIEPHHGSGGSVLNSYGCTYN